MLLHGRVAFGADNWPRQLFRPCRLIEYARHATAKQTTHINNTIRAPLLFAYRCIENELGPIDFHINFNGENIADGKTSTGYHFAE